LDDVIARFFPELLSRVTGPMMFRFILQPLMAMFYAYRDGVHDARLGRPPYLHTMLTEPAQRKALLTEGLKAVSRVIVLGIVMDTIYQIIVFGSFRPVQIVVIVLLLAFVPYLLFRGPVNRLARRRMAYVRAARAMSSATLPQGDVLGSPDPQTSNDVTRIPSG
jgi:hypothetical protein